MDSSKISQYGSAYGAGQVAVTFMGRLADGCSGITYGETQEMQNTYGMGKYPLQQTEGKVTYEGSIVLKAFEVDALEKTAPNGNIRNYRGFYIMVSVVDEVTGLIKSDRINYVRFTGKKTEFKAGTDDTEYELPLLIGGIEYNV